MKSQPNPIVQIEMAIISDNLTAFKKWLPHTNLDEPLFQDKVLFQYVVASEKWDFVKAIVSYKKADSNNSKSYGATLLKAVQIQNLELAECLLNAGAPTTETTSPDLDTCLHQAVKNKDLKMVKLLLQFNADLSAKNAENYAPISVARSWEMVTLIASTKPDNNDSAQYGNLLLDAVRKKQPLVTKKLLLAGASLTWTNGGDNCYHWAMKNKDADILALLLIYGGEKGLTRKNTNQQTLFDLAKSNKEFNDILLNAWKIYQDFKLINLTLIWLLLGHRQANSELSRLPFEILNLIVSHLHLFFPSYLSFPSLREVKNNLIENSTHLFLKEYTQGRLHHRSTESLQLINNLNSILINGEKNKCGEKVENEIKSFLQKKYAPTKTFLYFSSFKNKLFSNNVIAITGGDKTVKEINDENKVVAHSSRQNELTAKKTRAVELLVKYHLTSDVVPDAQNPSKFRLRK